MPQTEVHNQEQKTNKLFYGIFVSVILAFVAIGVLLLINNRVQKKTQEQNATAIPTETPIPKPQRKEKGSLTIKTADGVMRKKLTEPILLEVIADSQTLDVTGYDVLLGFDKTHLAVKEVKSLLPDFTLFQQQGTGFIMVTGVRMPASQSKHEWQGMKILLVELQPDVKGTYSIQILPQTGKRTTKLVDKNSQIYSPTTTSIEIVVE